MDKYLVDFTTVDKMINKTKAYKLADVKHLIQKVAFDVVRFRENGDTAQLWRIEQSVDGPVIVAMYERDESVDKVATASKNPWHVLVDNANNLNFMYKGEAIAKVASVSFGCDDPELMSRWLPARLASEQSLRTGVLNSISEEARDLLFSKFPELRG